MQGEIIFTDKESVLKFIQAIFDDNCKVITVGNNSTKTPRVERYLVKYEQK